MTPSVICLTPVWNEAWILDRFLRAASTWADRIIVADQSSDDGSRDIVQRHSKAVLVENRSSRYDEGARQRLLLEAARQIDGPRVLVALDADEMLTARGWETPQWRSALQASPGTVIRMPWVNLLPGCDRAWVPGLPIAFGFVDDGREHVGPQIHSTRLPASLDAPSITLDDVAVLHLQYLDTPRMRAKQRWYQCFERVEYPTKRPAEIYRQYHHMDAWPPPEIQPVKRSWVDGLELDGLETVDGADVWHGRILDLMREHGTERFRQVDIWDVDWAKEARRLGAEFEVAGRPRSVDRVVLSWLRFAQPRRRKSYVRAVSRALEGVGW